ncbi:MAG: hypothetical protein KAT68_13465 [Bacteroidales bacterium]|nr:hypothetical protein [Bacteroidales bacterium]
MQSKLDKANKIFRKAHELKETARKDKSKFEYHKLASEKFFEASEAYDEIIKKGSSKNSNIILKLYSIYYLYEGNKCLCDYYYELRDNEKALIYAEKSTKLLENLLSESKKYAGTYSEIEEQLKVWIVYDIINHCRIHSIQGRKRFDESNFVEALDFYKLAVTKYDKAIDQISKKTFEENLDPVYLRIARGNRFGMNGNIYACYSKIILNHKINMISQNDIDSLKIDFFSYLLSAYINGKIAYKENPEWEEYKKIELTYKKNVNTFLKENKKLWLKILNKFENKEDYVELMKNIDNKLYKKLNPLDNKPFKIWSVGGFFLLAFVIIFSLIYVTISKLNFFYAILLITASEIILIIIGGLILKSLGELSEKGFLSLIKIAFENQFKIIKLSSKNLNH